MATGLDPIRLWDFDADAFESSGESLWPAARARHQARVIEAGVDCCRIMFSEITELAQDLFDKFDIPQVGDIVMTDFGPDTVEMQELCTCLRLRGYAIEIIRKEGGQE